jgi:biopolymer transport protein ExbD
MRKEKEEAYLSGNLTAMIDVVFQLIIFFVCTVSLQESALDRRITLAMAPHGTAVGQKDPLEITIEVNSRGGILISRIALSAPELDVILRKAVAEYGSQIPVVIRADGGATHNMVRTVMDTCAAANLWKIKIAALKEKGS